MSILFLFALVLVIGSGVYLVYLNSQPSDASLVNASRVSYPLDQTSSQTRSASIGVVFLVTVAFYFVQLLIPVYSLGFFGTQIGLNFIAAIFCFATGRSQLGRTFLLCLLWVCLIGPAILISLCFVIAGGWGMFNR